MMRVLCRFLIVALILSLAIPAMARTFRVTITLSQPAKIAGKTLEPGNYEVLAEQGKVILKLKSRVVAEVQGEWKERDEKSSATAVVLDGDEIREIRFGGKKEYVYFPKGS